MCKVFADYETLPFSFFRACSEYISSMLHSLTTSKPCSYEVLAALERAGALSQSISNAGRARHYEDASRIETVGIRQGLLLAEGNP